MVLYEFQYVLLRTQVSTQNGKDVPVHFMYGTYMYIVYRVREMRLCVLE